MIIREFSSTELAPLPLRWSFLFLESVMHSRLARAHCKHNRGDAIARVIQINDRRDTIHCETCRQTTRAELSDYCGYGFTGNVLSAVRF